MIETLTGSAAKVARELLAAFPGAHLTSARRTVANQALQMARNVVRSRPRDWIGETYKAPLCRAARLCRDLAGEHPEATAGELAWVFTNAISGLPGDEQRRLSKHLTGEAFDLLPGSNAMREFLHGAADREGGRFLTREGGLDIWHWQGP